MVAWKYAALVLFFAWITGGRDARASLPGGTQCYIVASFLAFYTLSSAMIGGLTADNLCAAAAEAALWAIGQSRDQRRARLGGDQPRQAAIARPHEFAKSREASAEAWQMWTTKA